MKLQGDSKTGAGHAGLMDMLNDIFAPGKEHSKEQQQYDERVGRRESKIAGKPLDFGSNKIAIVVDDSAKNAEAASPGQLDADQSVANQPDADQSVANQPDAVQSVATQSETQHVDAEQPHAPRPAVEQPTAEESPAETPAKKVRSHRNRG